jgi:hypothetical protein
MAELNNPIPEEWTKYVTQSAIGLEVVPDQLYATQTYVDNTTTQLTFFNAVAANQSLSNMTQPGLLPNPQSFLIQAVRLHFDISIQTDDMATSAAAVPSRFNDLALLCNNGRIMLTIGTKQYGPWKLWTLGAGTFLNGPVAAAGAEAANQIVDYAQLQGQMWGLFPHLMLSPLQNFQVDLFWPAVNDLTGNVNIEILFDGQRARGVQ